MSLPQRAAAVNPFPPTSIPAIQARVLASTLKPSAKNLLLVILTFCQHGQSSRGCFASSETLAARVGLKPRQVGNLMRYLEVEGWIEIRRDSESKFSRKTIFPVLSRLVDAPSNAEPSTQQSEAMHLATAGSAPSNAAPASIQREGREIPRLRIFSPSEEEEKALTPQQIAAGIRAMISRPSDRGLF